MNPILEKIKEQAKLLFARGAQLLVFLAFCHYLLGCVVAERPIGPRGYVSFVYYSFQWRAKPHVAPRVTALER